MKNKLNGQTVENFLFKQGGKYPVIGISMAFVHAVNIIYFQLLGITSLVILNLISITGYLIFSAEAYRGNRIKEFFYFLTFEVPISGLISTVIVGWNFRFMLIVTGCIPCIFYFIIFIDKFKRRLLIPTMIGTLYSVLYLAVRIYCDFYPPMVSISHNSSHYEAIFTYFNTIVSFIITVMFNLLTAVEYNYIKNRMLKENSRLDVYATYDPLTNLLNIRSTDQQLQIIYDAHYHDEDAFSLIMCDIDHFKNVNDTYGHDVGDFVLKEVAQIIKSQVREKDIVGRWGGEEFLIVVHDCKLNTLVLAERIRASIENHVYKYNSYELNVTITLGVSSYHANSNIASLVKSADMKLYRGKKNGRNQVVS